MALEYDHPAWQGFLGMLIGYLLILGLMTAVLFGVAWLVFTLL